MPPASAEPPYSFPIEKGVAAKSLGKFSAAVNAASGWVGGGTGADANIANSDGGGVSINGGEFTMTGGTINGNTAFFGGGVYVDNGDGTFDPQGGTVSDNKPDNVYRKPKPKP